MASGCFNTDHLMPFTALFFTPCLVPKASALTVCPYSLTQVTTTLKTLHLLKGENEKKSVMKVHQLIAF